MTNIRNDLFWEILHTGHCKIGDKEVESGLLVPDQPDSDEYDAVPDNDESEKNPQDRQLDVLCESSACNGYIIMEWLRKNATFTMGNFLNIFCDITIHKYTELWEIM